MDASVLTTTVENAIEPALARMRSYEGMKITAPSRSIEVEAGGTNHD
jgi:hypothetical protein